MENYNHTRFMRRCLDLAVRAEGLTRPNPMVGAVVVHKGLIIGEGYHRKAGGPHAEVVAIGSVNDKNLLGESTLYVSLEPCSHFGKTPPCTDMIIDTGIRRIVAGTIDTSSKVSGRGFKILKEAGCEVITGILEKECREINAPFFSLNERKRPYITLKWAQSADGFIDRIRINFTDKPVWISGESERVLVHKWRASNEAILVGAGTIRADNPSLNVREWTGNNPLRIVLSGSGSLPGESAIFRTNGTNIVFTTNKKADFNEARAICLPEDKSAASHICGYLFRKGIGSLLVEGGARVLNNFIEEGLWDEARVFYGNENFGKGVEAPLINGILGSEISFNTSLLKIYFNKQSGGTEVDGFK